MTNKTALLVIDVQMNMFEPLEVTHADAVLARIQGVIQAARAAGTHVIYFQFIGDPATSEETGSPGWQLHPAVAPQPGDIIIQKEVDDSFAGTPLQIILDALGVRRLVLVGMQSEYCIDATARRAHALGYAVVVPADAHSTFDAGGTLIEQINGNLGEIVQVMPSAQVAWRAS